MRNSAGSSGQSHFARIPSADIQRSAFDRSSNYKTTFDAGYLIPFFFDEVLPGDTFSAQTGFLARLATPLFPYMDNVYMDFHFFFIPNRLVWENWERFNGAQDDPNDSTDFLCPQLSAVTHAAGFGEGSIYDYFGLPTKIAAIPQARMPNAFLFRSYRLVWNTHYRDENLQNSVAVDITDGPDTNTYALLKRGRRKDYFTSALPWPQKGPAVSISVGTAAPVQLSGVTPYSPSIVRSLATGTATSTGASFLSGSGGATTGALQAAGTNYILDPGAGTLIADLSAATGATINEIREAFQLQRLFERDARGGTRYVEILLSHFGVVSPDFRLQRPEYLGGGSVPINVNPIAQTSESNTTPQGNLSAFATARGIVGFNKSFVEHGHVLGLVSVRADQTYQQGMHRMWSRQTRYDFYWPSLAHLGEQAVLNKEIYCDGSANDELVFGYQERYAEYRYKPSIVTAGFRSNHTTPLDTWHLALDFNALPTLAGLVEEDPPIDRIIAVPTEPQFIFDSHTKLKCVRPMPVYSVPGLIDHF